MPRVWNGPTSKGDDVKHRLFTIVSVASSLLFVATCILWVRSLRVEDVAWWIPTQSGAGFVSSLGKLEVGISRRPDPDMSGVNRRGCYSDSDLRDVEEGIPVGLFKDWRLLGIHLQYHDQGDVIRWKFYIHDIDLLVAFSLLPLVKTWSMRRARDIRSVSMWPPVVTTSEARLTAVPNAEYCQRERRLCPAWEVDHLLAPAHKRPSPPPHVIR